MGRLIQDLEITKIKENPVALRSLQRTSESYLGLVESIRAKGFMGTITVREKKNSETGEVYYEVVDGLHRFNAVKDVGLTTISVDVIDLSEAEVLEAQIMANIHKVETKPVEYSKQLIRILAQNPLMTESELATRLGKSPQWIKERLGLVKIESEQITELINEGKIGLSNAYALAKLPNEEMNDWIDRAMTLPPEQFIPQVNNRAKEIRDAKRQGKEPAAAEFQPVAHLRSMKDIKAEVEDNRVAAVLIKENKIEAPEEAFRMALLWALHLDPKSAADQLAKHEQRQKEREEAKARRKAEREAAKAKAAAEAAAEITA